MPIFNRETPEPMTSNPAASAAPAAPRTATPKGGQRTHVAAGSRIQGEITGATELAIDGEVHGHLKVDNNVEIGSRGAVKGEIHAKLVRVGGRVEGNIRGTERIEILASGNVEGDVAAPRVVITDGAFFKGNVEMTGSGKAPAAAPARPSTPTGGQAK